VDVAHYAAEATDLVNADLDTIESVRRFLSTRPLLAERVTPEDLGPLQQVQQGLAAVVDASARAQEEEVVALLNDLLSRHVIRPRISGHDASTWHLHVNESDAPASTTLIAEALFGLTLLVTDLGALRLGRCASPTCGDAFVDTSPNRSRRFCSSRCATRTNVAALRERRRTAAPATAG
jgi:predicted RNA-binding Zn ribbon-like protein